MLRFAPLPTGDMHISNLRVAILNYLVAQQKKEQFLVRIVDTDSKKNIEGKDTEIMMLLEKFALKHNSVFHQSEHLNIHQTLAIRLLDEGKAFVCSCSDEQIDVHLPYNGHCQELNKEEYTRLKESGEPFVLRLKKPDETIVYRDLIRGDITSTPNEIDDFVILRADGTPSYDFAVACDDMLSDVDFIICEENQLSHTPKQIHVKNCLGYENTIQYLHLPLIVNDEASSVKWLFEQGFVPDAILNYLLLLEYSQAPTEIFTLPQAIEWFDIENISQVEAIFDMNKLRFINREHLKMMNDKQLSTLFGFADADIGKLAKVYLEVEEYSTINALKTKIQAIFRPKDFTATWGKEMTLLAEIIADAPAFESFEALTNHLTQKSGLKESNLLTPLSYLLTAQGDGSKLNEIYPYIKSYILEVAS